MSKLSDNDIKKALEYKTKVGCELCDIKTKECCTTCIYGLAKCALDLINRLEAENEKLNVELVGMRGACNSYKMHYDNAQAEIERLNKEIDRLSQCVMYHDGQIVDAKAEAVKEFAERLKAITDKEGWTDSGEIDDLVKELTEVTE